jgi:hypothetical protein
MEIVIMLWAFISTLIAGVVIGMVVQTLWMVKNNMINDDALPKKPWWWFWK